MPDEWENIAFDGKDGYLRTDYTKTTPRVWSALQHASKEIEDFKEKC